MKLKTEIRGATFRAGCALLLACACVPASAASQSSTHQASTHQDSSSNAAAKKPASATTSTAPHHKATTTAAASKKSASKTHTASTGKRSSRKKPVRGQQKIDSERAQAIQQALIREHYLSGEPTGTWNQNSEEAMRRYQTDHGWQNKEVPDSRALIKLGLGPSNDHLLNPESAMTTVPDRPSAQSAPVTSHSADPEAHTSKTPTPRSETPDRDASHPQ